MPSDTIKIEPIALSISAAAAQLGVARSTLYRLRASGEIGFSRIAGKPVVLRSELDRYVETLAARAERERGAAA